VRVISKKEKKHGSPLIYLLYSRLYSFHNLADLPELEFWFEQYWCLTESTFKPTSRPQVSVEISDHGTDRSGFCTHTLTAVIDLNSTRPEINLNKEKYRALYCFTCGRVLVVAKEELLLPSPLPRVNSSSSSSTAL